VTMLAYISYTISCVLIYFTQNIYFIIPLCSCFGFLMTILNTFPYEMLYEFHLDENYVKCTSLGSKRGLGIDCALLSVTYFFSQVIVASSMSFLIVSFGNKIILIIGALFGLLGFFNIAFYFVHSNANSTTKKKNVLIFN
jgi:solute carrier family 45 protein 1/2/4